MAVAVKIRCQCSNGAGVNVAVGVALGSGVAVGVGVGVAVAVAAAGTGQKLRFDNGLRAFAYRTETALCPRFLEWTISLRYSGVETASSHARRTSSIAAYL
jgi:hypothetical protein